MNFKWFKKILDFYHSPNKKDNDFFKNQFDQFLKIEDALFCYKMMEEGFNANSSQKEKLNNIVLEKVENKEYTFKDIMNVRDISKENKINAMINCISDNEYINYENIKINEVSEQYKEIITVLQDPVYQKEFNEFAINNINHLKNFYISGLDMIDVFSKQSSEQIKREKSKNLSIMYLSIILVKMEILNQDDALKIKQEFKECAQTMLRKTSKRFAADSLRKIGYENISNFTKVIGQIQTNNASDKKEELLKQYKSYKMRQKTLTEEMQNIVVENNYSIENLPPEAKQRVNKITKVVDSLNNPEVNEFIHERLPIILKKYFSIDEEYRTSLKNVEGFNAQELMLQSLENIERIIVAKQEDNNYDLLSELSVENRKLKMR